MRTPTFIGKYRIEGRLGQGGMGTVYLAEDPLIGRPVAIKMLRVDNDETRRRFESEARSAGRLKHPSIVTVFDYSEENGSPYLVMEYVEGQTVSQAIKNGAPLSDTKKIDLIGEALDALHYAHDCGVIHRDIKPSNLMLTPKGGVKVLDFGIARNTDTRSSRSSQLVGTAAYMAPEQIKGEPIDRRCDLFSMGAVLQEFLTGVQAFDGETDYAVMDLICTGDPAPFEHPDPDLARLVRPVLAKAMSKNPQLRYQSAEEFAGVIRTQVLMGLAKIVAERDASTIVSRPAPTSVEPPAPEPVLEATPDPLPEPVPEPVAAPVIVASELETAATRRPARGETTRRREHLTETLSAEEFARRAAAAAPAAALELREFMTIGFANANPSVFGRLMSASATIHLIAAAIIAIIALTMTEPVPVGEVAKVFFAAMLPPPPPPPVQTTKAPQRTEPATSSPAQPVVQAPPQINEPVLETPAAPVEPPTTPPPIEAPPPPPIPSGPAPVLVEGVQGQKEYGNEPVSKVTREPVLLEDAIPVFPPEALRRNIKSAEVVLEIVVNRDGSVSSPRVIKGHDLFNEAALEVVMKFKYRAARLQGTAVAFRITQPIQFVFGR